MKKSFYGSLHQYHPFWAQCNRHLEKYVYRYKYILMDLDYQGEGRNMACKKQNAEA